jgi:hypothetical protein
MRADVAGALDGISVPEWIGMLGALVGVILGLRSEIRAWRAERPRLRVVPKVGFATPNCGFPSVVLGVEVINLGALPVTIDQVGFTLKGSTDRLSIGHPLANPPVKLPVRLEGHSSLCLWLDPSRMVPGQVGRLKKGFVMTATDQLVEGGSRALRKVASAGRLPRRSPVTLMQHGLASTADLSDWNASSEL